MTDAGLKVLAASKQLQFLGLIGCQKVTDAGLKELAACKQLKSLDVRLCPKVTDAGVADLKKALPKLAVTPNLP